MESSSNDQSLNVPQSTGECFEALVLPKKPFVQMDLVIESSPCDLQVWAIKVSDCEYLFHAVPATVETSIHILYTITCRISYYSLYRDHAVYEVGSA